MTNSEPTTAATDDTTSAWRSRIAGAGLPVAAVVAVAALIAAIVFAGLFGYRWYDDAVNKEPVQTARDDALGGAEQVMVNFLSIDLKDRKAYQSRVDKSLVGSARSDLLDGSGMGRLLEAPADATGVLTAKVLRSALVDLNTDDNTAKVLLYLSVQPSGTPSAAQETGRIMGFQVEVVKQDSEWKASKVTPLDAVTADIPNGATAGGDAPASSAPTTDAPAPGAPATPSPAAPAPTTGAGN